MIERTAIERTVIRWTEIRRTAIGARRTGTPRTAPCWALWRLLRSTLLWFLPAWLLLGASAAWAAPAHPVASLPAPVAADQEAPMCDVHAASIAARPDVPEVDDGKVEELPCDVLLKLWGWGKEGSLESDGKTIAARHAAPPRPLETSAVPQRPEAVIEVTLLLPDPGPSALLPESLSEHLRGLRGHRSAIFRPPLARA